MFLTPVEFYYALKDKDEYELSKIKPVCEAIRMEAWWLVNVNLDKRHRIRKKERIMEFPWDLERRKNMARQRVPQTKEQMVNIMKAIAGVGTIKQKKQINTNRRNMDRIKAKKNHK